MKYEALNVYTQKGTELTGVLFSEKKSDWLMIAITGVHGNFYSNPFYVNIGQTLNENGIDFLYAQTRDAFGQMESNNRVTGKKEIIGSFNEDFNEADNDIEAYLDFAQKQGYRHVVLAGHSLGANKVIHYLANHDDPSVDYFIFLSPANVRYLTSYLSNAEKQEIMDKIKNGQEEEMLSFSMFGWFPAKARTAEQWLNSPVIDNVHSGDAGDFSPLNTEINLDDFIFYKYYPESNQTLEFTSHETNFKIQPITSNYDDPFFLNDLLIERNDRLTTDVEYILLDKQSENYYAVSKTTLKPLPAPSLYEAATNQEGTLAYRGKDARNKYLAGLINLNYFYQHDQLFYNVGMIGNGMQNKEPVASVIRKIECLNNKNLSQLLNVQQLLQSMDVVWVRFKNLTVLPFPIKLMNEYIRKNQNNEKR